MKDPIDRLTPLSITVLALLREGDMHPYELIQLMRSRRTEDLLKVTNGAVYHAVVRLEKSGFVDVVGVDREGTRPERTTYTLTDEGRDAIDEWVRRELPRIERPVEFRVAIADAHGLPRDEAVTLLEQRRQALLERRAFRLDRLDIAHDRGVPDRYLIEIDHGAALLQAEADWIGDLIKRINSGELDWGDSSSGVS